MVLTFYLKVETFIDQRFEKCPHLLYCELLQAFLWSGTVNGVGHHLAGFQQTDDVHPAV